MLIGEASISVALFFALGAVLAVLGTALTALGGELVLTTIRRAEHAPPAPDIGVLICDAVDEKTLASVARQVEAELLPTRSERKRTSGRTGSFSFPIKVLTFGLSSSRGAEDTDTFEDTDDTNVLLGRVLRVLDNKTALRRDLVRVPGLALETDERFDDAQAITRVLESHIVRDMAPENTLLASQTAEASTDALVVDFAELGEELSKAFSRAVPLQRLAESLRGRWQNVADGTLVLVEGPWAIEQTEGGLILKLAALTVDEGEASPERTIDMPAGLAVECQVPTGMLLDHRVGRLRAGQRMTLGVFGVVSPPRMNNGTLTLEPTAVFERLETPGEGFLAKKTGAPG
jgi:hypothetical protein